MHKLIFTSVKEKFEKEGYKLLSSTIKNAKEKLEYICPVGHKRSMCWNNFQQGKRCRKCSDIKFGLSQRSLNIKSIKKNFKESGYVLLTSVYQDAFQKLEYICPKGHHHSISWANWQQGKRCPYCSNHILKTIEEIRFAFESEGFILLTDKYRDAHQKFNFICPKGHQHAIQWANWQQGYRCAKCSRERMREISKKKWTPQFTEKLRKLGKQRWADPFFQQKMWKALAIKPNKPETILLNLLNQLFPNEYKYIGDFQFFLGGKNPDFMNCNHQKKLIECYGTYWHKNDDPQDRINHFRQYGFETLVIWENELKDRERLVEKLQEFHGS